MSPSVQEPDKPYFKYLCLTQTTSITRVSFVSSRARLGPQQEIARPMHRYEVGGLVETEGLVGCSVVESETLRVEGWILLEALVKAFIVSSPKLR